MGMFDFLKKKKDPNQFDSFEESPGSRVGKTASGAAKKVGSWVSGQVEKGKTARAQRKAQEKLRKEEEDAYWEDAYKHTQAKVASHFAGSYKGEDLPGRAHLYEPKGKVEHIKGLAKEKAKRSWTIAEEAWKLGIDPMKRVPIRVQTKDPDTGKLVWKTDWLNIPKTESEIKQEIIQTQAIEEGMEHELKAMRSERRLRPVKQGLRTAGSIVSKTVDLAERASYSPQLRPMGRGSGSVTPTGIRGGQGLFTPRVPRGPASPLTPMPGEGLGGLRNLTIPGVKTQSQGSRRIRPF